MDTKPIAAPTASTRHAMRFEGLTSEYFKIWIVNLALTIVTLGVFSAWAKVRSKRYLYGNTYIADHAFDYHASPIRILLGRVIAVLLLGGYSLTSAFARPAVSVWILFFIIAFPWLIKSSLRFSARNTSYRNLRFDFHGTYWGAVKAFVLWQAWAIVTLFIALPFAHRARDYYNINNHSYGPAPFRAKIPVGQLYTIYLLGLGVLMGIVLVAMTISTGVEIAMHGSRAGAMASITTMAIVAYVLGFLTIPTGIATLTFNLALNNTSLGDGIRFESRLSPLQMIWIRASNLILTLLTLGLLYPWGRMRMARYRASCITVIGPADISDFIAQPIAPGSAIGEEIASFFDIDFGL